MEMWAHKCLKLPLKFLKICILIFLFLRNLIDVPSTNAASIADGTLNLEAALLQRRQAEAAVRDALFAAAAAARDGDAAAAAANTADATSVKVAVDSGSGKEEEEEETAL